MGISISKQMHVHFALLAIFINKGNYILPQVWKECATGMFVRVVATGILLRGAAVHHSRPELLGHTGTPCGIFGTWHIPIFT